MTISTIRRLGLAITVGCVLAITLVAAPAQAHTRADQCVRDARPLSQDADWTAIEREVWRQACERVEALAWDGDVRGQISKEFLRTILTEAPFRDWLEGQRLTISGAWFPDGIDLAHAELPGPLFIHDARIDGDVDLAGAIVPGSLIVEGVEGSPFVNLSDANVGGELRLVAPNAGQACSSDDAHASQDLADADGAEPDGTAEAEEESWGVDLLNGRVGGDIWLYGTFHYFSAEGVTVEGYFEGTRTTYGYLSLARATVAGHVAIACSDISDGVRLNNASVGDDVIATAVDMAGDFTMDSIDVGGSVVFGPTKFEVDYGRLTAVDGVVDLDGARIGRDVRLNASVFGGAVDLDSADIGIDVFADCNVFDDVFAEFDADGEEIAADEELTIASGQCRFNGGLLLNGATVGGRFTATGATFDGGVLMEGAAIGRSVSLEDATVHGPILLDDATVGDDVAVRGSASELILDAAAIGGDVSVEGSFDFVGLFGADVGRGFTASGGPIGGLDLIRASIADNVDLAGTFNCGVSLVSGRVGGNVNTAGSTLSSSNTAGDGCFDHALLLDGASIGGDAVLTSDFTGPVALQGASITGDLDLTGAAFDTDVSLNGSTVGGAVALRDGTYAGAVDIEDATIGDDLDLTDATFASTLSLIGSQIGGVLSFSTDAFSPEWIGDGRLDLRGSDVGGVAELSPHDGAPDAWPTLRLTGFTYGSLDGVEGGDHAVEGAPGEPQAAGAGAESVGTTAFLDHTSRWYAKWLQKEGEFSRAPYLALEAALRDAGKGNTADNLAIALRDRELGEPGVAGWERALGLVHRWTVGYGYKPEWSAYWIVGLIVVGWAIGARLLRTARGRELGITSPLMYSIDRLLPLVTLREAHTEVDVGDMPRRYQLYYGFHAFAGYALAAALVTAFSGLAGG